MQRCFYEEKSGFLTLAISVIVFALSISFLWSILTFLRLEVKNQIYELEAKMKKTILPINS